MLAESLHRSCRNVCIGMSRTRLNDQRCGSAALTGFRSEADVGNTGLGGRWSESSDLSINLKAVGGEEWALPFLGLGWWEHYWTDSQSAGDTGFYSGFASFCPLVVAALETEVRTRLGRCSFLSCNSRATQRIWGVESFPTLISPTPAPLVPSCIFCLRQD